jgi:hypothetical protein
MDRKICIFSLGAAALLILSFFPTAAVELPQAKDENLEIEESEEFLEPNGKSDTVKLRVIHIKKDKTHIETIKELTTEEEEALWQELRTIEMEGKPAVEVYRNKLDIMKNYNLVPDDMTLEDIMDIDKLEKINGEEGAKDISVYNALVFFVGGGLGFGIGVPFFITTGMFLMALLGFGYTLIYEIFTNITHTFTTFFIIPVLLGFLIGFTGLLLLPVLAGFFYSNALGLGICAYTQWGLYPKGNQSSV